MKTTNNTVLITGGSAGIGLAMAKMFSEQGNHVIITGRDEQRLRSATAGLRNVTPIVSDVTNAADVALLAARLEQEFPNLNLLINNAGQAYVYDLLQRGAAAQYAAAEMQTNYLSIINITDQLLPLLLRQPEAAVVNVSSIVAFVASQRIATYAASKAALHAYTQSLRHALAKTSNVKVFELMPPLVNTDFSKEIGGENGIPAADVAADLLRAIQNDTYEIHVGATAQIYELSRANPAEAFRVMNPA